MTNEHHKSKTLYNNSRRLRPIYQAQINAGQVACRRCRKPITAEQKWHLGHIVDAAIAAANGWPEEAIHAADNLSPEHQRCNTSAGGKLSQTMAANKRAGQDLRHGTW